MTDSMMRELLDPSHGGAVALGNWRQVLVAGAPRLAYVEVRRWPDGSAAYHLTVYREPIPPVMRLSKAGANKLLATMTDQSTWEAFSETSLEEALEAVRWVAAGYESGASDD